MILRYQKDFQTPPSITHGRIVPAVGARIIIFQIFLYELALVKLLTCTFATPFCTVFVCVLDVKNGLTEVRLQVDYKILGELF